jgi:putative transposase
MMTYTYKLYRSKRTAKLDAMLREACFVWNHALALQKRYYSLYGKFVSCSKMKAHFAKRIRRHLLHSQTVQEILERLDISYKRFFKHLSRRPPKFRKARDFSSIVYKQGGVRLCGNVLVVNSINQHFQFSFSRPYEGKVRQIRIKRSRLGEYYLCIVTDAVAGSCIHGKSLEGASVGMDFGLKTYLTLSDGTRIENPQFLKSGLNELRRKSRALSRCEKGSGHRRGRRKDLERCHERIRNRRDDWQWKTCHDLCCRYDTICIEDLSLLGMTRLWGRKVNDLAFGAFVQKLEHVASKYGTKVVKVDRFYPSSKTCSVCQYVNEHLSLRDRHWTCPDCGASHDRDLNASVNILRQGIASSGSTCKTQLAAQGALATGESPAF